MKTILLKMEQPTRIKGNRWFFRKGLSGGFGAEHGVTLDKREVERRLSKLIRDGELVKRKGRWYWQIVKPKRIIKPRAVWIVFDPEGKAREASICRPDESAIAWPYASDVLNRGWVQTPTDTIAAHKAGYRVRCFQLK